MDRLYDQSNVRDVIRLENFDTFDLRLFSGEAVPEEGASPQDCAFLIFALPKTHFLQLFEHLPRCQVKYVFAALQNVFYNTVAERKMP